MASSSSRPIRRRPVIITVHRIPNRCCHIQPRSTGARSMAGRAPGLFRCRSAAVTGKKKSTSPYKLPWKCFLNYLLQNLRPPLVTAVSPTSFSTPTVYMHYTFFLSEICSMSDLVYIVTVARISDWTMAVQGRGFAKGQLSCSSLKKSSCSKRHWLKRTIPRFFFFFFFFYLPK